MSSKHSAGKGSRYRPVDQSKWDENWEKAFKKKKKETTLMEQKEVGKFKKEKRIYLL